MKLFRRFRDRFQAADVPAAVGLFGGLVLVLSAVVTFQDDRLGLSVVSILVAGWLLITASRLARWQIPAGAWWLIVATVAAGGLSWWLTDQRYFTGVQLWWQWLSVCIVLLGSIWASRSGALQWVVAAVLTMQIVNAAVGLVRAYIYHERVGGLLFNANGYGGYALWGIGLALTLLVLRPRSVWRWTLLIFLGGAWIGSVSLTAFVGALPMLAVFGWLMRRRLAWKKILLGGGIFLVILGGTVWWWQYRELPRLMSLEHVRFSYSQRAEFIEAGWRMWLDRPWTGWGIGTYKTVFPRYTDQVSEQPLYAHNLVIQWLAETGVFVTAGMVGLIGLMAVRGWRRVAETSPDDRPLWIGLYAGWVGFTAHALMDFSWYFVAGQVVWALVSGVWLSSPAEQRSVSLGRAGRWVSVPVALGMLTASGLFLLAYQSSWRGQQNLRLNRVDEAIASYQSAIALTHSPSDVRQLGFLMLTRRAPGDFVAAETAVRSGLAGNEGDYFLWHTLARIHIAQGEFSSAVGAAAEAVRLNPRFQVNFHRDYALSLARTGDFIGAERALRSAADIYRPHAASTAAASALGLLEQTRLEIAEFQ